MNFSILLIPYLFGFVITYILCKRFRGTNRNSNTWTDVFITIGASLLCPLTLTVMAISQFFELLKKTNPPKWM